ncbi:MAG: hypothetical protein COT18_08380 [Elusimicrobia bacterium CG08_land_8_20_14_0_20_59_10]|nr:MAG: hypothetical protein COT18_08380 [Elusimicrobia bacterium CG08_land_8_20_14_0_20_59_10]
MRKNKDYGGYVLILAFCGYFTVSMILTALILLLSLAAAKAVSLLAAPAFGAENFYRFTALRDSGAFSVASALSVPVQYLLVSFMLFSGMDRRWLAGVLLYTALFCGLFFWRFAAGSGLGTYPLSGLPVMLACILGGAAALTDEPGENPWPPAVSRFFL